MRIEKANQYGATWVKDWSPGITHVIMDDHLKYQDLIKFLKLEELPVWPPVRTLVALC
jgi:DNA polymerase IV